MTKELIKKYADKIIEVVYYDTIPDKETVGKVIYALIDELSCQQTKELQQKVEQLQFELRAADSVNEQLQTKIDELEKETLLKIEQALRYFNGFDSEDQNEAAFHALNNLKNQLTSKKK